MSRLHYVLMGALTGAGGTLFVVGLIFGGLADTNVADASKRRELRDIAYYLHLGGLIACLLNVLYLYLMLRGRVRCCD